MAIESLVFLVSILAFHWFSRTSLDDMESPIADLCLRRARKGLGGSI